MGSAATVMRACLGFFSKKQALVQYFQQLRSLALSFLCMCSDTRRMILWTSAIESYRVFFFLINTNRIIG